MIKPGGNLLLANFVPTAICRGYMEASLGWWLVYRDDAGMRDLVATIPLTDIAEQMIYTESEGHIVFLEVTHA